MAVFIPVRRIDNNPTEEVNPSYEALRPRPIRSSLSSERGFFDEVFWSFEFFWLVSGHSHDDERH